MSSPVGCSIGSHLDPRTTSTFGRLIGSELNSIEFSIFRPHLDSMAISVVSGSAKTMNLGFVGIFVRMMIVGIGIAIGTKIGRKVSLSKSPFRRKVSFSDGPSSEMPANYSGPCLPQHNKEFKQNSIIKNESYSSLLAPNRFSSRTLPLGINIGLVSILFIPFIINNMTIHNTSWNCSFCSLPHFMQQKIWHLHPNTQDWRSGQYISSGLIFHINMSMQHKIWQLHPNTDWRSGSYIPSGTQKPSDRHTHANRTRFPRVTCDVANPCYEIEERDSYSSSITSLPSSFSYEVIQHRLLITANISVEEEKCSDQFMSNKQVKRRCLSADSSKYLRIHHRHLMAHWILIGWNNFFEDTETSNVQCITSLSIPFQPSPSRKLGTGNNIAIKMLFQEMLHLSREAKSVGIASLFYIANTCGKESNSSDFQIPLLVLNEATSFREGDTGIFYFPNCKSRWIVVSPQKNQLHFQLAVGFGSYPRPSENEGDSSFAGNQVDCCVLLFAASPRPPENEGDSSFAGSRLIVAYHLECRILLFV